MILNVLSYLETSVKRVPERVCWADARTSLTYREVWSQITRIGSALAAALPSDNCPVCVLIRHDVTDLIAFFSIVYSGNFYVPIDPSLPRERVEKMMATLMPAATISNDTETASKFDLQMPLYTPETLLSSPVCEDVRPGWKKRKDTDLLYVIFTSGSTGEPKGVSVCHRSVIDMAEQFCEAFGFEDGSVWGNQAPFDFDVSVKDIFLSLKVGGTLQILEKKLFSFPKLLIGRLNERCVDTIIWAVPALKIIASLNAFKSIRPLCLKKSCSRAR